MTLAKARTQNGTPPGPKAPPLDGAGSPTESGATAESFATADTEVKTPPKPQSFRLRAMALGVILLGATGILSAYAFVLGTESTDNAQVDAELLAVPTRTEGVVARVAFIENQHVEAGDLLAELDAAPHRARLAKAEGELLAAEASRRSAEAQALVVEALSEGQVTLAAASVKGSQFAVAAAVDGVAEARAQLSAAEGAVKHAEDDLARADKLGAEGLLSQQELEAARARGERARAELEEARARLRASQHTPDVATAKLDEARARLRQTGASAAQVAEARAHVEAAEAQVAIARASRDLAALELSYTRITAPRAGFVSRKVIVEGQSLSRGQPVATLVSTETLRIVANFKEVQIGKIAAGQRAEVTVDAFSGKKLAAEVQSVSGATGARFSLLPPDNATGNFVKVVQRVPVVLRLLERPAGVELRPGMSAEVTVDVAR